MKLLSPLSPVGSRYIKNIQNPPIVQQAQISASIMDVGALNCLFSSFISGLEICRGSTKPSNGTVSYIF